MPHAQLCNPVLEWSQRMFPLFAWMRRGVNISLRSVSDQQTSVTWKGALKDPEQANKKAKETLDIPSYPVFLHF